VKTEVLIIGGGCAGLTLALSLGKKDISTILVDAFDLNKMPSKNHFGRTAALMGNSVALLTDLGIWKQLKDSTASLQKMRIIDDGNPKIEPLIIDFNAHEIGLSEFGHNIPNIMLQTTLLKAVKECPSIEMIFPDKLGRIETHNSYISAKLESGKEIKTTLLVGADGKKSKTRALVGIKAKENHYGQSAITCLFTHSKPHNNISTEHHRPGGPFTTVPMPDRDEKYCSSLVWVEKEKDVKKYISLDKKSFERAIQDRTRHALGTIELETNPESWPLIGLLAERFTAPRTMLIAEAAHAFSPLGAQGLNLSLRDVSGLSSIIVEALQLGEDIGSQSVLNRYEERRRLDIKSRTDGVNGYNRLVSNNIEILRLMRRAGLKSLDTIPALKKIVMKQGLAA
jgi:2-octaprenyl-6-methoxyphenol hydroxylase